MKFATDTVVSKHFGFRGNYGIFGGLTLLALVYLKFFVHKVKIDASASSNMSGEKKISSTGSKLKFFLVNPLIEMALLFTKKRPPMIKLFIGLQFFAYSIYIFAYYSESLLYLFMMIQFENFDAADYAYFSVTMSLGNTFFLVFLMPIVSGKLKMNDALLLTFISVAETMSYITMPFITNLPLFYIVRLIGTVGYCKYSTGRSLLSKCCGEDETGKLFSALSVSVFLTMLAVNPITRTLYNNTLDKFPGAFLLLSGGLVCLAGYVNIFFYSKRRHFEEVSRQNQAKEGTKDKTDLTGVDSSTYF